MGRFFAKTLIILLLTALTQIGGIIYIFNDFVSLMWLERNKIRFYRLKKYLVFLAFYLIITFTMTPPLAMWWGGRMPLPIFKEANLAPVSFITCLLNRHYVRPETYTAIKDIAAQYQQIYPGQTIGYLDANLPFIDGFPLLPHLSHNDGKKIDLAFFYTDTHTNTDLNGKTPTMLGYGFYVEPRLDEVNQPANCMEKGFWQYDFAGKFSFADINRYQLQETKTQELVELIIDHPKVKKVFIEPHLKKRFGLEGNGKVRYHGCQSVRHDDHIHIEIY